MMPRVENVHHGFEGCPVLQDMNTQIARGQFVALVGGFGCGKTTLVWAVPGNHPPDEGGIYAGNRETVGPGRDVGVVYRK
jgi:ABC-type nitrate/sulfonate/bicarbonate transport system ATPase subunit